MAAADGMSVAEAAMRLGISKEAVRRRIDRKTLRAIKGDGGTWHVLLDDQPPPRSRTTDTMTDDMPRGANPTTALLAEKDARIALLTDQLSIKDRQIQELHVMLQTAQRQLPATTDAPQAPLRDDEAAPPSTPDAPQRGAERADGLLQRIIRAVTGGPR